MRVWGYHAVNVLLHAIVSCLVVLVCKRLLTRPSFTTLLVTGLAFALHPVHTEAVSGLVGRAEILSGLFFCLSMLTYHRAEGNALLVLPAVVLAAAAALSKEQGVTVIGVACVYDLFVVLGFDARAMLHASSPASGAAPRKETQSKKAQKAAARAASSKPMTAGEKFAMRQLLLWTSFAVFMSFRLSMNSVHIEVDAKTNPANHIEDFVNRGLTKALYCTLHAWLLIFPRFLSCDWAGSSIALVEGLADPRNLGTLALVGALGALGLYALFGSARRETRANLIVALALLIVPFVPSTGLFMEVGFVLAERVLYLPRWVQPSLRSPTDETPAPGGTFLARAPLAAFTHTRDPVARAASASASCLPWPLIGSSAPAPPCRDPWCGPAWPAYWRGTRGELGAATRIGRPRAPFT